MIAMCRICEKTRESSTHLCNQNSLGTNVLLLHFVHTELDSQNFFLIWFPLMLEANSDSLLKDSGSMTTSLLIIEQRLFALLLCQVPIPGSFQQPILNKKANKQFSSVPCNQHVSIIHVPKHSAMGQDAAMIDTDNTHSQGAFN